MAPRFAIENYDRDGRLRHVHMAAIQFGRKREDADEVAYGKRAVRALAKRTRILHEQAIFRFLNTPAGRAA